MEIDRHIGCAMSGLTADARTMVEHARVTAQVSVERGRSVADRCNDLMVQHLAQPHSEPYLHLR